ncbi:MAG: hypothetical protein ACE5DX_02930 [Candidatus Dojkabacteria bacterium]
MIFVLLKFARKTFTILLSFIFLSQTFLSVVTAQSILGMDVSDSLYATANSGIGLAFLGKSIALPGGNATNDIFPVYQDSTDDSALAAAPDQRKFPPIEGEVLGRRIENWKKRGFKYFAGGIQLWLRREDYYYGKWLNARAGVNEIDRLPVITPGKKISLIGNGYLTLSPYRGYVRPPGGYYYGSGLCWSVSALGGLLDNANRRFKKKYGFPMFAYQPGDRRGHGHNYKTYSHSNKGWGYTVIKVRSGIGQQDYTFQLNPRIKYTPGIKNLKLKIILWAGKRNKKGYLGQTVGGHIYTNIKL